jgi:hypothetical protein
LSSGGDSRSGAPADPLSAGDDGLSAPSDQAGSSGQ